MGVVKVNRITASRLSALGKCRSIAWLRQLVEPTSKYAEIGNAAHAYLETGVEQHDTFLEVPRFQRPEERTWAEVKHEWRFGWNFRDDTYIAVPAGKTGRDYDDYPADAWVMGSADAVWEDDGVLYVEDLKTGAPQDAMCEQLIFLAHCAASATGHTGDVSIQILNATRYGYATDKKVAGKVSINAHRMDVATLRAHFEAMVRGPVLEAVGMEGAGEDAWQAAASNGKNCFFCPSKVYCLKFRAKATPKSLMYLDKLREAQEARTNEQEQGERHEGSGQGDNGPDTGGHDGSGAG